MSSLLSGSTPPSDEGGHRRVQRDRCRHARRLADDVYAGIEPLTADDIADCIVWAVTRPPQVDIDFMVVRPVAQAASHLVARIGPGADPSPGGAGPA